MNKSKNKWEEFWHLYGQGIACRRFTNTKTGEKGPDMYADEWLKDKYQKNPEAFVELMEVIRQDANEETGKFGLLQGIKSNDDGETIQ